MRAFYNIQQIDSIPSEVFQFNEVTRGVRIKFRCFLRARLLRQEQHIRTQEKENYLRSEKK